MPSILTRVYVLTSPIIPTLNLQPSEVDSPLGHSFQIDSVHFVSLDLLLSPTARTFEYVNTSRRLVPHAHPLIQKFLRLMLGQMKFAAIKLEPTSSVPPHAKTHQLQLWGLTLGTSPPNTMLIYRCSNGYTWYISKDLLI